MYNFINCQSNGKNVIISTIKWTKKVKVTSNYQGVSLLLTHTKLY